MTRGRVCCIGEECSGCRETGDCIVVVDSDGRVWHRLDGTVVSWRLRRRTLLWNVRIKFAGIDGDLVCVHLGSLVFVWHSGRGMWGITTEDNISHRVWWVESAENDWYISLDGIVQGQHTTAMSPQWVDKVEASSGHCCDVSVDVYSHQEITQCLQESPRR